MQTYIILLRGVNVGGNNLLPMKDLKSLLEENGFNNVKTYIQSGNIVLSSSQISSDQIATLIKTSIETKFGFTPKVIVLTKCEFELSVKNNPYQGYKGKFVHFYFCEKPPEINLSKLQKFTSTTERHALAGNVFYIHAPDGIGRSKLVANIESCLGVSATGRNLNTVNKLARMIDATLV